MEEDILNLLWKGEFKKVKKNSSQNFDSLHLSYTFSRALIYETVNFKIASQNYGDTVNSHVTVYSENYFLWHFFISILY